jgi:photosystem II oxygen-evolving enhancer protein 3
MAQAMASMTGLSQGVLPSRRAANRARAAAVVVRASAEGEAAAAQAGRRAVLGLVATGVVGGALSQAVHAATVNSIKIGAPPPPSGGLREFLCLPARAFIQLSSFFDMLPIHQSLFYIHLSNL